MANKTCVRTLYSGSNERIYTEANFSALMDKLDATVVSETIEPTLYCRIYHIEPFSLTLRYMSCPEDISHSFAGQRITLEAFGAEENISKLEEFLKTAK